MDRKLRQIVSPSFTQYGWTASSTLDEASPLLAQKKSRSVSAPHSFYLYTHTYWYMTRSNCDCRYCCCCLFLLFPPLIKFSPNHERASCGRVSQSHSRPATCTLPLWKIDVFTMHISSLTTFHNAHPSHSQVNYAVVCPVGQLSLPQSSRICGTLQFRNPRVTE